MIISTTHQATFLAVPRTASQSILRWFELTSEDPENDPKVFGGYHERTLPSELAHWFSFAVVRHPYPRAVSFWMKATQREVTAPLTDKQKQKENLFTRCGGEQDFKHFTRWLARKRPSDPKEWRGQYGFIHGIRLSAILHFETLAIDFQTLPFFNTDKHPELPWLDQKLGDGNWQQYYDNPATLRAVQGWAGEDFERFGYSLDYHLTGKPFA